MLNAAFLVSASSLSNFLSIYGELTEIKKIENIAKHFFCVSVSLSVEVIMSNDIIVNVLGKSMLDIENVMVSSFVLGVLYPAYKKLRILFKGLPPFRIPLMFWVPLQVFSLSKTH